MSFAPLRPPAVTLRSIEDILRDVASGKVRVPQFLRNFRWEQKNILELFDSIYRGYPIGTFLFWETDKTEGSATRFGPISFAPAPKAAFLVIDGQQRLTTIAATLLREREPKTLEEEDFLVFFDLGSATFKIPRPRDSRPAHWLPLSEIVDTIRYLTWLERLPREADRDRYVQVANQAARALRDYKIPICIVRSADEREIRRVFERLNAGGKPLRSEEIFLAIAGNETGGRHSFGETDKRHPLRTIKVIREDTRRDRWERLRAMASEKVRRGIRRG